MPCTPPPGGVAEEHRKTPGSGVEYGTARRVAALNNLALVHRDAGDLDQALELTDW